MVLAEKVHYQRGQYENPETDSKPRSGKYCVLDSSITGRPTLAGPMVGAFTHTPLTFEPIVASNPSASQEMEAFWDSFFETKMAELHIPGAPNRVGWVGDQCPKPTLFTRRATHF